MAGIEVTGKYKNKVIYGTTVLVDLTADTVTKDTLKKGATAHDAFWRAYNRNAYDSGSAS